MIKKLSSLLIVGAASLLSLHASQVIVSCNSGTGTNPATFNVGGAQAQLSGATLSCPGFTIPMDQTLMSVEMVITNSFSQANAATTNTINFTYSISGFDSVTGLTTSSQSSPADNATDAGGIVMQAPGSGCSNGSGPSTINCFEISPVTTSFTVTASSFWQAGGLVSGGSDGFSVTEIYTYVPTSSVPEPASLVLIGSGLLGLGYFARRKRKV